tara:strand:+ start:3880 stop:4527 length:648 start_codon:yes stop_codon:yes gene_type:complete
MKKFNLAFVIPAKNEDKTIYLIVKKLVKFSSVYVVNDCSDDNTLFYAVNAGAQVINNKKNLGYEKSIWVGIDFLLKKKNIKYICTVDADGELDLNFFKKLRYQNFDIIIGSRDKYNRYSEYIFSFFSKIIFGIRDMLSGARVYNKDFLIKVRKEIIYDNINTNILLIASKRKKMIIEKQIKTSKRIDASRFGNGLKTNLYICYVLLKNIYLFLKK